MPKKRLLVPFPWHPFRQRLYHWLAFGGARGKHTSLYKTLRNHW